jgi:hypothetical protein
MTEFFSRKRTQKLYTPLDLLSGFSECTEFLLVSTANIGWIWDAPMSDVRFARKDRTGFLGAITHGDNDVKPRGFEFIP